MEPEDLIESLAWALPFLALAGVFYLLAAMKERKGRGLHNEAQELIDAGQLAEARDQLLKSLWSANETPALDRRILSDLGRVFEAAGVAFDAGDYLVLIRQFEQLSKKGSHKAWSDLKQVQGMKAELIDAMPAVGSAAGAGGGGATFVSEDITDPERQFETGVLFFNGGEGVAHSHATANEWFEKAAVQGHREAQFILATSLHAGRGIPKDVERAYHWYLKAAEQGHDSAQRTVGIALLNGDALPQDVPAAIDWLTRAADVGEPGALYNLGACYYNGQGVTQDEPRGLELIRRAAESGHRVAQDTLVQLEG